MRVKTRRLSHLATQPRLVATLVATVLSLCVASRVQAQVTVLRGRVVLPTSTIVGEVMISGVTIIEGTSPGSKCVGVLVRNAENQNALGVGAGHIRTYILDIKTFKGSMDFTTTKSFVVHLAEGTNDSAKAEFQTLKQKGLLHQETASIHGTAFGDAEFAEMGQVGASLIWSPQSNMALYQKTTNIPLAKQHGVNVSIGVD